MAKSDQKRRLNKIPYDPFYVDPLLEGPPPEMSRLIKYKKSKITNIPKKKEK